MGRGVDASQSGAGGAVGAAGTAAGETERSRAPVNTELVQQTIDRWGDAVSEVAASQMWLAQTFRVCGVSHSPDVVKILGLIRGALSELNVTADGGKSG